MTDPGGIRAGRARVPLAAPGGLRAGARTGRLARATTRRGAGEGVIAIYHKADCTTSRKVLAMIREAGHDPVVIDYLAEGWTRPQLLGLFAAADLTPRQALRVRGTDAAALGLTQADDDTILSHMTRDPVLVERPFVCGPGGVRLCRPAELVRETFAR